MTKVPIYLHDKLIYLDLKYHKFKSLIHLVNSIEKYVDDIIINDKLSAENLNYLNSLTSKYEEELNNVIKSRKTKSN